MLDQLAVQTIRDHAVADGDKIKLTCGQLQRDLYQSINDLFARFRGEWKGGKVSAHVFPFPITGRVVIDSILAGNVPPKNPYDLFPTPDPVLDLMMAEVLLAYPDQDAELVFLEPSAGTGAIAGRLRDAYPNARIDCIEIDPINVRVLESQGFTVCHDDFSTFETDTKYDAVVMNPPFAGTTYIDHINKAVSLTAEHGVTVAISPYSLVYSAQRNVSTLLAAIHDRSGSIEELPKHSFKASGTSVDTLFLSIPGCIPQYQPLTSYASRRIDNLLMMADNDYETYKKKCVIVGKYQTVRVDMTGAIVEPKFIKSIEDLYTGYMRQNPLSYFAILEPWEWQEIAKGIVEEYGIETVLDAQPGPAQPKVAPIAKAPKATKPAKPTPVQIPMFS